jgi:hypothetical protein
MGQTWVWAWGMARKTPAAAASPAAREERLPLKESMAITTFMARSFGSLGLFCDHYSKKIPLLQYKIAHFILIFFHNRV